MHSMWSGVRRLLCLLGLFAIESFGAPALAGEGEVPVRVDCPALTEEQRAALESRAKAELLVRHESGTLLIACSAGAAVVRWQPQAGAAREDRIELGSDARRTQERILEAVDRLLSPAPVSAVPAPPVAEPAPVQPAAELPPLPPALKPPAPKPRASRAPAPMPRAPQSTAVPAPRALAPQPASSDEAPFVEVLGGAGFELWSSEAGAVLGPEARVVAGLPAGWAISAGALLAWTLRAPEDVSGRLLRGRLGAEYHLGPARRFRVGAALLLDWLTATRDVEASSETEHDLGLAGLIGARYLLFAPPLRLALGPDLTLRGAPVRVVIADREVFRIPALAAGASAELVFGPF
jgi:hypothetical protein